MGKRVLKTRLRPTDVQEVIWRAPTAAAAARELNVNESSVSRWLKAGTFTRRRPLQAVSAPVPALESLSWGDRIRRDFDLTPEHDRVLMLAERAWRRATDDTLPPADQIRWSKEYRTLMEELGIGGNDEAPATPERTYPRRA